MAARVEFFFDPGCPWTWMASRWLTEVSQRRGVQVRWRSFSLRLKNEGVDIPEQYAARQAAALRALRVIEAVRHAEGDRPISGLYTELGRRIHHEGDNPLTDIHGPLAAAGLDRSYAEFADDGAWDGVIRASMAEAMQAAGEDVGSPILVFPRQELPGQGFPGQTPVGFFGPIVSPTVSGDPALQLWDGITALAGVPAFYELKRSRTGGPRLESGR